ncbi:MAG: L,D-transpeptidase family protein [Verrucomicrobiota bacterium]
MRCIVTLLAISVCAIANAADPLASSQQCLVVTTNSWKSDAGTMSIFHRNAHASPWLVQTRSAIAVRVGRKGLAWGRGVMNTASHSGPIKREGDDKAPAGVFPLRGVFGQALRADTRMPYLRLTPNIVGVDDPSSRYYNQLIDKSKINDPDWKHAEKMFGVDVYKWGVLVDHNLPPTPGAGSCIFLHVWKSPATSTSGCTAMAEKHLLDLIRWLDPSQAPMLVQLPRSEYKTFRAKWNLP